MGLHLQAPDGGVLHKAGTRYDAEVTSLKLVSPVDDGIVEPNDNIMVSEIQVVNNGGLPLPDGVSIYMPSTKTVKFEPTRFDLPSEHLLPHQSYVIPATYHGRIFDQPPPNAPVLLSPVQNSTHEQSCWDVLLKSPFLSKSWLSSTQ